MGPDPWPGLVTRPADGETDPRFSAGLVFDVAEVIGDHGYPELADWPTPGPVELQQSLLGFLYGPTQAGDQ